MKYFHRLASPLGELILASDGEALTGLWFPQHRYGLTAEEETVPSSELPVFGETDRWLDAYFSGEKTPPLPPLRPQGTPFRQKVWQLLLAIPAGQLTTYGAIARELERQTGRRASAQAVGGAVGHNPVSILIPCHRVVGSDGSLTGYGGGLARKLRLLKLEGVDVDHLYLPKTGTAL